MRLFILLMAVVTLLACNTTKKSQECKPELLILPVPVPCECDQPREFEEEDPTSETASL